MGTITRRITAAIHCIPQEVAVNGTVTSPLNDKTVLLYTGTTDWTGVFGLPTSQDTLVPNPFSTSSNSTMANEVGNKIWIYVPTGSVKLAQVIGFVRTSTTTFSLQLDRVLECGASACYYVDANLLSYSFLNDGGGTGTANGINILDGENEAELQLAPAWSREKFKEPVVIDATSTDFLIQQVS